MSKVYLAIPRTFDQLLGHVSPDGKVFRSRVGLDARVGEVDLSSGKVYSDRFGPDKEVGRVDLKTGKVYLSRLGPDEYIGNVDKLGRMHRHISMSPDEYIGNMDEFISYAHSGGAMLLLVLPASDEKEQSEKPAQDYESSGQGSSDG